MRSPPLPLMVLLAIAIAADGVVYVLWSQGHPLSRNLLWDVLFAALLAAQTGLIASWFILGANNFLVRLSVVIGIVLLIAQFPVTKAGGEGLRLIILAEFVVAIALTVVPRFIGFQWVLVPTIPNVEIRRLRQFEIRELLGWTMAVAVLIAVIRQVVAIWDYEHENLSSLLIMAGVLAGLSLLPLTLALPRVLIPLPLAMILFAAAIMGGLTADGPQVRWPMVMCFLVTSLIQCIWILTARACGYRLMRLQRCAAVDLPKPPDVDPWSADAES